MKTPLRVSLLILTVLLLTCPLSSLAEDTTSEEMKFVCFGDSRSQSESAGGGVNTVPLTKIVAQAIKSRPVLALFVGDPFLGSKKHMDSFLRQAGIFKQIMQPLADVCPVYYTYGNHESNNQQQIDWMTDHFSNPGTTPGFADVAYSFTRNGIHFVSVATMLIGQNNLISDAQLDWLKKDLAAHRDARHIFVFGHSPAFPVGPHVHSALDKHPAQRDAFWNLLQQYRVDAYFCGHEHLYNSREISGVRQILTGSCGAPLASGFGGSFYHYAELTIRGAAVNVVVRDEQGKVQDQFDWTRGTDTAAMRNFVVRDISPVPHFPVTGRDPYQPAYRAFLAGHYEEALSRFQDLLLQSPDASVREGALSCLAVSCEKTNNDEMAIGIYTYLIQEFPRSAQMTVWCRKVGLLEAAEQEWEEAAHWFEKAALNAPTPADAGAAWEQAGRAWDHDQNPAQAVRCYQQVLAGSPQSISAVRARRRLGISGE